MSISAACVGKANNQAWLPWPAAPGDRAMLDNRRTQFSLTPLLAAIVLGSCAHLLPVEQPIEVKVEADTPEWAGPLSCRASNGMGHWLFEAPGTVTVLTSRTPLVITCQAMDGTWATRNTTPPISTANDKRVHDGAKVGASVGAGAGVVVAVAAAPVLGVPIAVAIAVGAALKGAEIGGIAGAATPSEASRYPSVVILKVKSERAAGGD
jgi:hypothetical protein